MVIKLDFQDQGKRLRSPHEEYRIRKVSMAQRSNFEERTVRGEKNFPLSVYHNKSDHNYVLGYHWHTEVEFILVEKGDAVFYVDTTPFQMHEGEALFVNSGQIHGGQLYNSPKCEFCSIVFFMNMLHSDFIGRSQDEFLNPLVSMRYSLPVMYTAEDSYSKSIIDLLSSIISACSQKAPGYEMSVMASLYSIIHRTIACGRLLAQTPHEKNFEAHQKERFKDVLDFIHSNFQNKIGIEDMAAQIHLSPYHFCRFFKHFSGETPFTYLNHYRINHAARLMCSTNKKIMDIAFESGFANFSYFIKLFKQIKGCTPSAFRKNH